MNPKIGSDPALRIRAGARGVCCERQRELRVGFHDEARAGGSPFSTGASAFAAVGAATEAAARVWAIEYAPVRINVVLPGIIDTEVWDQVLPRDAKRAQFESVASALPVGRVGTADDVARAVEFAITNEFIAGTTIEVDGGHQLT